MLKCSRKPSFFLNNPNGERGRKFFVIAREKKRETFISLLMDKSYPGEQSKKKKKKTFRKGLARKAGRKDIDSRGEI